MFGFDGAHRSGHVVAFYDHDADLTAAVALFLRGALDDGGTAIVVATPPHRAAILAALDADHAIGALEQSKRLVQLDARTVLGRFMGENSPDRDLFVATLAPVLACATGPVRVFGEMVALLWEAGLVAAAIDLESQWNDLAEQFAFDLFCAYPAAALDAADGLGSAKHICDRHSQSTTLGGPRPIEAGNTRDVARVFVPARAALADVRGFVREVLDGWNLRSLADEAQLVTSELATNATLHASSPFRVSLRRDGSSVTVAVRDACQNAPAPRTARPTETSGRGLELIEAIADSWGTRPEVDGKTVWATLAPTPATI